MVKKLLVLMLVLGLVSVANAVLSLTVDGGDSGAETTIIPSDDIVVGIYSDNSIGYGCWILFYDGARTIHARQPFPMGDLSSIGLQGHYANYNYYYVTVADSQGNLVPGIGFEVDYHADGLDDILVELYDESYTTILDTLVVHQVPEPITIALLGLGGLLLRRRK